MFFLSFNLKFEQEKEDFFRALTFIFSYISLTAGGKRVRVQGAAKNPTFRAASSSYLCGYALFLRQ